MKKVTVSEDACIGCGACMANAKEVFKYGSDGLSEVIKKFVDDNDTSVTIAAASCPTNAIILEDVSDEETESCNCEHCECDHCECDHK